ncbi:MAG TPA: hypothetical protein VLV84_01175 [Candidatus Acidoferrales bacterium]|nr:hypothetical protein [Candidatus Acidoferrales bacterium]
MDYQSATQAITVSNLNLPLIIVEKGQQIFLSLLQPMQPQLLTKHLLTKTTLPKPLLMPERNQPPEYDSERLKHAF